MGSPAGIHVIDTIAKDQSIIASFVHKVHCSICSERPGPWESTAAPMPQATPELDVEFISAVVTMRGVAVSRLES
jgi:hypothetical protein